MCLRRRPLSQTFSQPSWSPASLRLTSWSLEPARAGTPRALARTKLTVAFSYSELLSAQNYSCGCGSSLPSHRIAEGSELRVALLFRLSQVCSFEACGQAHRRAYAGGKTESPLT